VTDLSFDAGTIAGILFAVSRVAGLVVGAPQIAKRLPIVGRTALALGIGWFLAVPVGEASLTVAGLFTGAVVNLAVGVVLGFISTLIFQVFRVAGGIIDLASGLAISSVFDPSTGASVTVFERLFDLVALLLFFVMGGPRLLVAGLAGTLAVVPLDGTIAIRANLADVALESLGRFFLAGLEVAMPALAALFLAEVVLGVAARMLPEANIFLLGLPLKLLIALGAVSIVLLSFPTISASLLIEMQRLMLTVTGSLA